MASKSNRLMCSYYLGRPWEHGSGPLKSIDNLFQGLLALIMEDFLGRKKLGFNIAQTLR